MSKTETNNEMAKSYVCSYLQSLSKADFSLLAKLGREEGLTKDLCTIFRWGNSPILILETEVYFSFYQWMKNGWRGSAKGKLAFSPKFLLKNVQLQTWKALLEESRMFHKLQSWRKGGTIICKI